MQIGQYLSRQHFQSPQEYAGIAEGEGISGWFYPRLLRRREERFTVKGWRQLGRSG